MTTPEPASPAAGSTRSDEPQVTLSRNLGLLDITITDGLWRVAVSQHGVTVIQVTVTFGSDCHLKCPASYC